MLKNAPLGKLLKARGQCIVRMTDPFKLSLALFKLPMEFSPLILIQMIEGQTGEELQVLLGPPRITSTLFQLTMKMLKTAHQA